MTAPNLRIEGQQKRYRRDFAKIFTWHAARARLQLYEFKIFEREANRPDPQLAIPIAGDDAEAVQVAAALVREAGFDPVVVGKLTDARRFQIGAPGFGQEVTAVQLKQKLSLSR